MTLFLMEHWKLDVKNESAPQEGVCMTIVLRRKILSEMMGTYLPSILLMMITFATTFFKPYFFEAALTVNLTNMLVMTTIFTSVMEKLPLTSYPKMIDLWLIFCQLVPFAEVVLLTAMEFLRDEDIEKVESVAETSNDTTIIDSGAETESRLGDPAVELETSEAWPDHQGRNR